MSSRLSSATKVLNYGLAAAVAGFSIFMGWIFTQMMEPLIQDHGQLYTVALSAYGIGSLVVILFILEKDWGFHHNQQRY